MTPANHYEYLELITEPVFKALGINWDAWCNVIQCHGDKCYGYKSTWKRNSIHFYRGALIYLLSYVYEDECRQNPQGFVTPVDWVVDNYSRFMSKITEAENKLGIQID